MCCSFLDDPNSSVWLSSAGRFDGRRSASRRVPQLPVLEDIRFASSIAHCDIYRQGSGLEPKSKLRFSKRMIYSHEVTTDRLWAVYSVNLLRASRIPELGSSSMLTSVSSFSRISRGKENQSDSDQLTRRRLRCLEC